MKMRNICLYLALLIIVSTGCKRRKDQQQSESKGVRYVESNWISNNQIHLVEFVSWNGSMCAYGAAQSIDSVPDILKPNSGGTEYDLRELLMTKWMFMNQGMDQWKTKPMNTEELIKSFQSTEYSGIFDRWGKELVAATAVGGGLFVGAGALALVCVLVGSVSAAPVIIAVVGAGMMAGVLTTAAVDEVIPIGREQFKIVPDNSVMDALDPIKIVDIDKMQYSALLKKLPIVSARDNPLQESCPSAEDIYKLIETGKFVALQKIPNSDSE